MTTQTAAASTEDVTEALRDVVDPELGINVVDLGLVYDLSWDGEYNADHFHEWATDGHNDWSEVRDAAGYLMRWRTRSGALLPIPCWKGAPNDRTPEES